MNRLGTKQYAFSDHLGNVLVTILDKRTGTGNAGGNYTGWLANISSVNDYYPFGMLMEERSAEHNNYRFGHNGVEKTNEIAGIGNHYTALFGEYSPRTGHRWNLDPKPDPSVSPYSMFKGSPIQYSDILLDTVAFLLDREGASGNGHMAMLFQNENGQWNYFSVGAETQGIGMVGTGTKAKTTFQPMVKKTDNGDVVNMTLDEAFAATQRGMSDGNAYDEMVIFNTNKKEDAIISKNVSALKERFDNETDLYQLWNNNCTDACQDAVEGIPAKGGTRTGIKTPSDKSTPRPNSYFPKLKKAANNFNYPYKNVAPPSGLDNFPSKPIYQQVDRNTNEPVLNTPQN